MRRILTLTGTLAVLLAAIVVPSATALDIKDAIPPQGQVGVAYFHQWDMSPGSGSNGMTFRISSGSLPPGLRLQFEGARWVRVVGTPTTPGKYDFYLQAVDVPGPWVCCTEEPFSITITTKLTITAPSPLPDAKINEAYSYGPLTASGGTVSSWGLQSGNALPEGLTLNANGTITGTPTKSGAFKFTVQANGTPNNDTRQLELFVLAPLDLTLAGGVPPKTPTVSLNGKVNTPFTWDVDAVGGRGGYTFSSTPLPTGLVLDATTGAVTGTPTTAGVTKLTMTVTDSAGATDTLAATLNVKALLAFSSTAKPRSGKVGATYSWKLPVSGASKTKLFVASGAFPPGLWLDEATGVVQGTPLTSGTFKVKFWVLGDPGTQISKTYALRIAK